MPVPAAVVAAVRDLLGDEWVRADAAALAAYGSDALRTGHLAELVVMPADTAQVSAIATICSTHRVPMVVRGAGTGYTGGSVPTHGGVVLSMERFSRILEIDPVNLLVVTQPNVITGDLQRAVEAQGLFYPPDPASLDQCAIGGNVAECAGGPRAFKYGTTRRYVLALEAVLASGEVIRTGSKAVKNVVGYDLTQLLVGSEGTLAIITEVTLRLIPRPPVAATLLASFSSPQAAVDAVTALIGAAVVPAAIELMDAASLQAVERHTGEQLVPAGTLAAVIVEVDGMASGVAEELALAADACRRSGGVVSHAADDAARQRLWRIRRELSYALRATGLVKINHDVVVPRGRVPSLLALVDRLAATFALRVACFGHAGDGNIHVNLMLTPGDEAERERARQAERALFEGVVALEGSITGEHGIGFSKAPYLHLELSAEEIALMRRVKVAFDPLGLLNPGKIFMPDAAGEA